MKMSSSPRTPEEALDLWDRSSNAYHNHPSNPSSCAMYEEHYKRRCPCEEAGQGLLNQLWRPSQAR
jgi:hypothetical protein